ncbi:hypothetical protein LCGC14_1557190 [marine sediment metagenome]|uniref:Uncharacterized protein n=1 Tax=marine sediment metagenome TaxID=412755 RepID=A0A0F9INK1_9ZZZZ
MFQVLENGKAADKSKYALCGFDNSTYQFFNEAQQHVAKWLGKCFVSSIPQRPDQKIDYNGYGDTIEIQSLIDEQELLSVLKECADLLEAWWKVAGSPVHSTELALKDAYRILEQKGVKT